MTLIDIFTIISILIVSSMCIYVVYYLERIFDHVKAVSEDIHLVIENIIPVLNDVDEITGRVKRIVIDIEEYWVGIDSSLRNLRRKISKLRYLKILRVGFTPTSEIVNNLGPIAKGISAFWSKYKHE